MTIQRRRIAGLALALGFSLLTGCHETCVSIVLHYTGTARGRTVLKMWREQPSPADARALVIFPSLEAALQLNGPASRGADATCWHVADPQTWHMQAWIDVGGVATDAVCADWDRCEPQTTDPQAETRAVSERGSNSFEVTLIDPI